MIAARFGKSHEFIAWEMGLTGPFDPGPFDQWPTGLGFEKFFGTLSGESDPGTPDPCVPKR